MFIKKGQHPLLFLQKIRSLSVSTTVKGDEDLIIPLCLETLADGCSVLIFCPTKNWCEKLAETIAREFWRINKEPCVNEDDKGLL